MEANAVSSGIFLAAIPNLRSDILSQVASYAQHLSVIESIRKVCGGGWQIFAKDSSKSPSPPCACCKFVC